MPYLNILPSVVNGTVFQGERDTDVVIPIMGATGSGKSTFVNAASGRSAVNVGHGTTSCTTEPCPVVLETTPNFPALNGSRLILLDTPGFDDTYQEDAEILNRIAQWLNDSHVRIGGVLYLYDISNRHFTAAARRNLKMLSRFCKDSSVRNVILVTTNWDTNAHFEDLNRREEELKATQWRHMVDNGLRVHRFMGTQQSAGEIINALMEYPGADGGIQLEAHGRGSFNHWVFSLETLRKLLKFTRRKLLRIQKGARAAWRGCDSSRKTTIMV